VSRNSAAFLGDEHALFQEEDYPVVPHRRHGMVGNHIMAVCKGKERAPNQAMFQKEMGAGRARARRNIFPDPQTASMTQTRAKARLSRLIR